MIKNSTFYRISGTLVLSGGAFLALFLFQQTIEILRGMNPAAIDIHSSAFFIFSYPLIVALCIGIPQFFPSMYRQFPLLHFVFGNLYILGVLLAIAPMGILLSVFFSENYITTFSFTLLHLVLWKQTRISVKFIVEKDLLAHLKGMIKSYTLLICSTAAILQAMCFPFIHLEFYWVFILIFSDLWLSSGFSAWLLKQFLKK